MQKENEMMRTGVAIGAALLVTIGLTGFLSPYLCGPCLTAGQARAESAPAERSSANSVTLLIEGMTCGACGVTIRVAVKKLAGVKDAKVDVPKKQAIVEYDPQKVTPQQIIEAINKTGFKASPAGK